MWLLLVGYVVNIALGLNSGALAAAGNRRALFRDGTAGFATMIVLACALIPPLGPTGAAIATSATFVVINVVLAVALARAAGILPLRTDLAVTVASSVLPVAAVLALRSWGHPSGTVGYSSRRRALGGLVAAARGSQGASPDRAHTTPAKVDPVSAEPLVTVVIPTRDRQELVAGAVASVLSQGYARLEALVVDDGSTPPVAKAALPDDERVQLLRLECPRGSGAARNVGIQHAKGSLVAFLDDDDAWRPNMLRRLVDALVSHGKETAAAECGYDLWEGGRVTLRYIPHPDRDLRRTLLERPALQPSTVLARRSALAELGGFGRRSSGRRTGNSGSVYRTGTTLPSSPRCSSTGKQTTVSQPWRCSTATSSSSGGLSRG